MNEMKKKRSHLGGKIVQHRSNRTVRQNLLLGDHQRKSTQIVKNPLKTKPQKFGLHRSYAVLSFIQENVKTENWEGKEVTVVVVPLIITTRKRPKLYMQF